MSSSRAGKASKGQPRPPSVPKPETPTTPAPPSFEETEKPKIVVWPEFNESELALEKWDGSSGGGKGKEKNKGLPFQDPDGMVALPPSLAGIAAVWKRPVDYITENAPVVVDTEAMQGGDVDLVSPNVHILSSEMVRWIVCEMTALLQLHNGSLPGRTKPDIWRPWDCIFPRQKGQTLPYYNLGGKYCIKLFWMGVWRKVFIDDYLPFDSEGNLLLPVSRPNELWLPLLTKAFFKVAALDFDSDLNCMTEFGDCSFVHVLTGWVCEPIPIRSGHKDPMWKLIKAHLPRWTPPSEEENLEKPDPEPPVPAAKDKKQSKTAPTEVHKPVEPQPFKRDGYPVVIFAAYMDISKDTKRLGVAEEQAEAAVNQSKAGLSPELTHIALITQTRKESLEQPTAPDPDALIPKFSYLGFKSRRQRILEAEEIAQKLAAIDSQLIEISSPLIHRDMEGPARSRLVNEKELSPVDEEHTDEKRAETKIWMNIDQFIKCFTTLYVFHKPGGYEFKQAVQDTRCIAQSLVSTKKEKGQSTSNLAAAAAGSYDTHPRAAQVGPHGTISNLLCVDSLKPIEIVINFSVISRWPYSDPKKKSSSNHASRPVSAAGPIKEGEEQAAGLLIVEEYMWDTLVTGQPLLKIKSTGTKAAALCMPPGRHLVRLNTSAPFGYHLEFWSLALFSFAEEDEVLNELTKESLRYRTHALNVLGTVANVAGMFDDVALWRDAFYQQGLGHRGRELTAYHCRLLYASLLHTLTTCLGDVLTKDLACAWKAFLQEGLRIFLQGMEKDLPKGKTDFDQLKFNDLSNFFRRKQRQPPSENWIDRDPTEAEIAACVKIQATLRSYWQRKLWKTVTQGSPEHVKACQLLEGCLAVVKENVELVAMTLFQTMFKMDPQLLNKFPFKDDEWSRAVFEDHEGHYKEQPAKSWFIMFRETFFVRRHGILIVPHVYAPVPACSLRVFNNDTGEEIPRVFERVMPRVYIQNKRGYTFVAEGRTFDESIPAGKCRLRLIGTEQKLLRSKCRGTVNCLFNTKELKEYYVPRKDYVFFRKRVKVKEDIQISFEISSSKPAAYIELKILDTFDGVEKVISRGQGKGHAVIPAFTFLRDGERDETDSNPDDEDDDTESIISRRGLSSPSAKSRISCVRGLDSRRGSGLSLIPESDVGSVARSSLSRHSSCSRLSRKRKKSIGSEGGYGDRAGSKGAEEEKTPSEARSGAGEEEEQEEEEEEDIFGPAVSELQEVVQPLNHVYVIQGRVLRNSWDVKESALTFVKLQRAGELAAKDKEKAKTASEKEGPTRANTALDRSASAAKRGKSKGWGKVAAKTIPSATGSKRDFESNVAHWVMKVVTTEEQKNLVDIVKDTEREDEISAMKQAWEAEEPGRAEKAKALREKFLNERDPSQIRIRASIDEAATLDDAKSVTSSENGGLSVSSSLAHLRGSQASLDVNVDRSRRRVSTSDVSNFFSRRQFRQHDFSEFVKAASTVTGPRLLDSNEIEQCRAKHQEELDRYRTFRESVLEARERDREARNRAKKIQLETAEHMQIAVDEARGRIAQLRESYRKKCQGESTAALQAVATPEPMPAEESKRTKTKSPVKSASRKGRK